MTEDDGFWRFCVAYPDPKMPARGELPAHQLVIEQHTVTGEYRERSIHDLREEAAVDQNHTRSSEEQ